MRKHIKHHQHHLMSIVFALQGNHAPDETASSGSTARLPATINSAQTSSGSGSTDESWQSAHSDHPCLDRTCDEVCYLCASCSELLACWMCHLEPYLFCMCTGTLLSQCACAGLIVMRCSKVAAEGQPESYSASTGGACRMRMASLRIACQVMMRTKGLP